VKRKGPAPVPGPKDWLKVTWVAPASLFRFYTVHSFNNIASWRRFGFAFWSESRLTWFSESRLLQEWDSEGHKYDFSLCMEKCSEAARPCSSRDGYFFKGILVSLCALKGIHESMIYVYFQGLETQIQEFPSPKIKYSAQNLKRNLKEQGISWTVFSMLSITLYLIEEGNAKPVLCTSRGCHVILRSRLECLKEVGPQSNG
jgi:hypothetical protein